MTNASDVQTPVWPKEQIEELIQEAVKREEDKRFRQLKWIVAAVGLVGVGTFGTLANYLIQSAVETQIERRTDNISDAIEFAKFSIISLKLELGTAFSQEDVRTVMNYLRTVKDSDERRRSPEFISALEQIVTAFNSAGQTHPIDEIFAKYENEIMSSGTIVEVLLHHYGQELVGRVIEPSDDFAYTAYEKLEKVAPSMNLRELPLAYRTLFECKRSKERTEAVSELLKASTKLVGADYKRFLTIILNRSKAENWMRSPTIEGREIEKAVRRLLSIYAKDFIDIYQIDNQELLETITMVGLDADEVTESLQHFVPVSTQ